MGTPLIKIEELMAACRENKSNVTIWDPALRDAEHFGLTKEEEIKDQIGNGFLEEYEHKNTKPLETWTLKTPAPMVEAYNFHAGTKYGYIAYFMINGRWSIKSLKKNKDPNPKNYVFQDKKLQVFFDQLKKQEEENEE